MCIRDRGETGTGRLAADVDDIGAIVEHLEAVRDCGVGIEVLATVAEGIDVYKRQILAVSAHTTARPRAMMSAWVHRSKPFSRSFLPIVVKPHAN